MWKTEQRHIENHVEEREGEMEGEADADREHNVCKAAQSHLKSDEKSMPLDPLFLAPHVADFSRAPKAPSRSWSQHWGYRTGAQDPDPSASPDRRFPPVHGGLWAPGSPPNTEPMPEPFPTDVPVFHAQTDTVGG